MRSWLEGKMERYRSGAHAGAGSFQCTGCEYTVTLSRGDAIPGCGNCGGNEFTRASIFLDETTHPVVVHEPETGDYDIKLNDRELGPGRYLAFDHCGQFNIVPLKRKLTRIGRSVRADVRLDSPTVSRRHAIIVLYNNRVELLDDRSLNGVFLNAERVDRARLSDGDEITIGCVEIRFLERLPTGADSQPTGENHLAAA